MDDGQVNSLPDQISITWHFRDAQEACPGLSDDEARAVLQFVKEHYDANQGINWDTLVAAASVVQGQQPPLEPS